MTPLADAVGSLLPTKRSVGVGQMIKEFNLLPATLPGPEEQRYNEWIAAETKKGMIGPPAYTYTTDNPPATREELFKILNDANTAPRRRMTPADYGEET